MTTENLPNTAPDTDDLDAFTDLFNNVKPVEAEPVQTEAEPAEEVEALAPEEVTEVEADEVEVEDSEAVEDEKPVEAKKPKNRAQERIDDLTAKARAAERERDELAKRLAALEQQKPTPESAPTVEPLGRAPSPDAKDADGEDLYPLGEFDPKYIRDLTRFTIKEEQAALRAEQAKEEAALTQQQARDELQDHWADNLATVKDKYDDLYERGMELEDTFKDLDPGYSEFLATTIKMMDKGPDVFYYLASNLDEAKRIVALGPVKATMALGRLEAMYTSGTKAKEPTVTKAPPPPVLNKGASGRVAIADDTDDLDAFAKKFFSKK